MDNNRKRWIDMCKQLPVGRSERVQCCGTDKSRINSNKADKYVSTCFRSTCKNYVEDKTGVAKLSALQEDAAKEEMKQYTIPRDTIYDVGLFPKHALVWLTKAGLHESIIRMYKIGYSPKYNRVVVPVYMHGKLVGAILRALDEADILSMKYYNQLNVKGAMHTCFHNKRHHNRCIITEDILSAIRLSEALSVIDSNIDVTCILGTGVMHERAYALIGRYCHIHVWLDGDDAGVIGTTKWLKKLTPYMKATSTNIDTKDPKDFTDDEICKIIQEDM